MLFRSRPLRATRRPRRGRGVAGGAVAVRGAARPGVRTRPPHPRESTAAGSCSGARPGDGRQSVKSSSRARLARESRSSAPFECFREQYVAGLDYAPPAARPSSPSFSAGLLSAAFPLPLVGRDFFPKVDARQFRPARQRPRGHAHRGDRSALRAAGRRGDPPGDPRA